jgi:hypothetical protein
LINQIKNQIGENCFCFFFVSRARFFFFFGQNKKWEIPPKESRESQREREREIVNVFPII